MALKELLVHLISRHLRAELFVMDELAPPLSPGEKEALVAW